MDRQTDGQTDTDDRNTLRRKWPRGKKYGAVSNLIEYIATSKGLGQACPTPRHPRVVSIRSVRNDNTTNIHVKLMYFYFTHFHQNKEGKLSKL